MVLGDFEESFFKILLSRVSFASLRCERSQLLDHSGGSKHRRRLTFFWEPRRGVDGRAIRLLDVPQDDLVCQQLRVDCLWSVTVGKFGCCSRVKRRYKIRSRSWQTSDSRVTYGSVELMSSHSEDCSAYLHVVIDQSHRLKSIDSTPVPGLLPVGFYPEDNS